MALHYEVVEQFERGKLRDAPDASEDVLVCTDAFVAVFDGATSKGVTYQDGLTAGAFAAGSLARALTRLEPTADAATAVTELTRDLARDLADVSGDADRPIPCATGLIYSVHHRQVWRVGDGSLSIDGEVHAGEHALDRCTAGVRAAYLQCLVAAGASTEDLLADDVGRALILPVLQLQHHLRNVDDPRLTLAYGAFDGRPIPPRFLEVFDLPDGPVEVVLASDGYPQLHPTLEETESHLAAVLASDPLMISLFPATKGVTPHTVSYDDRAYVRFRVPAAGG